MAYLLDLFSNFYFLAFLSLILAFLSSLKVFPVIIHIVKTKNMMDEPGGRKIHKTNIPTLGGIGLFVSFSLSLIIFGIFIDLDKSDLIRLLSILGATLILLFIGVKDDLIAISPRKKIIAQIFAACIVIFLTDLRFTNFNGLMGLGELSYTSSVLVTLFGFILTTNAFNLCDGIDGLAGSVALIGCCTFGFFFMQNEQSLMSLTSFILIGTILGFLRYNLSEKRKLFMGDSGSMFIGFLLFYQGISFLEMNDIENILLPSSNALIILLAVLSFPLLDTLRVFIIRAVEKRSPFSPDKNHIHHRLLSLGLTHKQSTLFIISSNWLVIGAAFFVQDLNLTLQFFICISISVALYLFPFSSFATNLPVVNNKKALAKSSDKFKTNHMGLDKLEFESKSQKPFCKSVFFELKALNSNVCQRNENEMKFDSEINEVLISNHMDEKSKLETWLRKETSTNMENKKIQNVISKRLDFLKKNASGQNLTNPKDVDNLQQNKID